jgi:hypothetical protein
MIPQCRVRRNKMQARPFKEYVQVELSSYVCCSINPTSTEYLTWAFHPEDRIASYLCTYNVKSDSYVFVFTGCRVSEPPWRAGRPEIHLRRLEEITIDYMVNTCRTWKVFSEKFFKEWKETILYASFFPFASVHNDCLMVVQIGDSRFERQRRVLGYPECQRGREFPSAE